MFQPSPEPSTVSGDTINHGESIDGLRYAFADHVEEAMVIKLQTDLFETQAQLTLAEDKISELEAELFGCKRELRQEQRISALAWHYIPDDEKPNEQYTGWSSPDPPRHVSFAIQHS